ncbi:MAG: NAD(+) synthase [SAR324 cluster bacterium]|nr:NAD(+) synthase [SAR324 cluster bacterium]
MQFIKVAGAALNQVPLDWPGNRGRIVEAIRMARREQVQLLCLPELCISGYGCEDAFHGESVAEQSMESLRLILPETKGLAVAVGLPLIHDHLLYNSAAMLVDGKLTGLAAKKVLAGSGVYYEPRWFNPWPAGTAAVQCLDGEEVPIGDLVLDLNGVRIRFEICEDAWGRGQGGLAGGGPQVDIYLNPSASHFALGKYSTVKGIVLESSRLSHAVYLYSNHLGNESGRLIFDGTILIASNGGLVAENRRFSFGEVNLVSGIVDLRANRLERRRLNYPAAKQASVPAGVDVAFRFKQPSSETVRAFRAMPRPSPSAEQGEAPPPAELSRNEEFACAVSLGLWDYLRKSRSRGFAVSLSGGVDSATVAVLVWTMVQLALAELGWAGFRSALAHIPDLPEPRGAQGRTKAARELVSRLLLTVYQGTENSSQTTRLAARGLAEQLGTRHSELDVGPLVKAYEALAAQALGRELSWEDDDIARQNIQARVRSPGIWLLANLEGLLLLSTSNRSEVGVGYATMDGDTSGGLAPIAGANKTFLRGWLKWVEAQGLPGLGALPALAAVNVQAPTAELRPQAQSQTDEEDLMPYPVLDAIEQAAIRDRMTPLQVWRTLLAAPLPGERLQERRAAAHVERFFRLWSRTQWKRERLAPSFHLDDENLDPRTWCRFPILSSGYESELEDLRREVDAL